MRCSSRSRGWPFGSGVPGQAADFAFAPVPSVIALGGVVEDRGRTKSYAAYAQADIHLTDKLDLQVGGRVTHDRKKTSLTEDFPPPVGRVVINGVFKKTKPTYSVGLNYKPVSDTLLYAKLSTGFLSGGAVGDVTFKPEYVRSYEAGVKTDLFDRRLRINAAVWDARYKGLQQAQSGATIGRPDIGALPVNSGTLKARGVELEVTAQPIDELTFGGHLGYTHKKLTNISPLFFLNQTRYKLGGVPSLTGGVYGQVVTQPIFDEATALFRLDALYQGKYIPIGGRAKVEVAAFGRNLTNNRDPNFPFPFSNILFTDAYQAARTYGAELILRY